ncbi:hypothetical protein WAI453_003946 [Rhynchosporium graminicola]|uniref:C2H2-type domain-containing protein n=1 Tax=Rhynchosporium graminicola TaxID=2792576 RepID=A0A1E1JYJ2_9HELO|nr:uncharacterized protein RCO7_06706 [Rhynchosporium commune]
MDDSDDSSLESPLSSVNELEWDNDADDPDQGTTADIPHEQQEKIDISLDASYKAALPTFDDAMSISSDSEGEIPVSPANRMDDDDVHEQVTKCIWLGCKRGDMGDMDSLVDHIHNEHIESGTRGKGYLCLWGDCARKGLPHASAYALKAHMRSHTREKPFYCTLPECDRAFTRSDALAKHHRTVHETEALRPSDPIPKSMSAAHKNRGLKPNIKELQPEEHLPVHANGTTNGQGPLGPQGWTSSYAAELAFTAEEEARGAKKLYHLLRNEIQWAEEEGESLKKQAEMMEELRRTEWQEKELLLQQTTDTEVIWQERRKMVLQGAIDLPSSDAIRKAALKAGSNAGSPPRMAPSSPSPMVRSFESTRDAAEVLAGMRQD